MDFSNDSIADRSRSSGFAGGLLGANRNQFFTIWITKRNSPL